jgi:tetratricopeptide (TPR) repeat protein
MATSTIHGQMKKSTVLRTVRPFLWSFLFILVLFGIRGHQYFSARTSVSFDVTLESRPVSWEINAECDGVPISSPARLPIGSHRLIVRHPKGRSFTTNLFLFYGAHPLGTIDLKRAMGNLNISIDPRAQMFAITGEEFRTNLNGISQCSFSVPTGDYFFEARFLHHTEKQTIAIKDGETKMLRIIPKIGAIDLRANVPDATVRVMGEGDVEFSNGQAPALICELPVGEYRILANHHGHVWEGSSRVATGITNTIDITFAYGAISFQTKPPGADIVGKDGRNWGRTPLALSEIEPGVKNIALNLGGFEPANVSFEVKVGETNVISSRLVRTAFAQAMRKGNEALSSGAYEMAIEAFETAAKVEPDDSDARTLLGTAKRANALARASKFGNTFDFRAAIAELEPIVSAFPNDPEAKSMLALFRERDNARRAADEENRSANAKSLLASLASSTPDGDVFERHRLVTKLPLRQAESALIQALKVDPPFKGIRHDSPTDAFKIMAEQEFMTVLQTSAGKRSVVIVGAEVKKGETTIEYEVLEYKAEAANKISIGNLIGAPVAVNYVPIHPIRNATPEDKLQARIREGIQTVREKVERAIGK